MISLFSRKENQNQCIKLENLDTKLTKLTKKVKEVVLKNGFSKELKDKVKKDLSKNKDLQ